MELKKCCQTCKNYDIEESGELWMVEEPCVGCINNPDHKDHYEVNPTLVKEKVPIIKNQGR